MSEFRETCQSVNTNIEEIDYAIGILLETVYKPENNPKAGRNRGKQRFP